MKKIITALLLSTVLAMPISASADSVNQIATTDSVEIRPTGYPTNCQYVGTSSIRTRGVRCYNHNYGSYRAVIKCQLNNTNSGYVTYGPWKQGTTSYATCLGGYRAINIGVGLKSGPP